MSAARTLLALAFGLAALAAGAADRRPDGDWIAGDGAAVRIVADRDGRLQVRVGEETMAVERERRDPAWRGTLFEATTAGAAFMRSQAGVVAYPTFDGFLVWGDAGDFPAFDSAGGRPRGHVRAWRASGAEWPRFDCQGEAWRFDLERAADLQGYAVGVRNRGSDALRCELDLVGARYCPGCRGHTDRLSYRISDRCVPAPRATTTSDARTLPPTGTRLELDVVHATFLSAIHMAAAQSGEQRRGLSCARATADGRR